MSSPAPDLNDALRGGMMLEVVTNNVVPMTRPTASGERRFEVRDDGTFLIDHSGQGTRLCGRLEVVSMVRDVGGGSWGKLLRWYDGDGRLHQHIMQNADLEAEGTEIVRKLLDGGLDIPPVSRRGAVRQALLEYLAGTVDSRTRIVSRIGWHERVFALFDETIGEGFEAVVYAGPTPDRAWTEAGTLADWNTNVARYAGGNSRLLLGVAAAFAAPTLTRLGVEGFGLHFVGSSSCGKTTTGLVASSVYADPASFRSTWRATSNGLEAQAAQHNDALFFLDELGQCDPEQASEAAYMLANGTGKSRANVRGGARESQRWRVLVLSTGEEDLDARLRGIGKRSRAGQAVRLLNLPADAGAGLGAFEDLHGASSPAEFANRLAANTARYFGAPLRPWLLKLSQVDETTWAQLRQHVSDFAAELAGNERTGQARRAAEKFAVLAIAGELAIDSGVVALPEGTFKSAVETSFCAWQSRFGLGSHEDRAIVEHARDYLFRHAASRFATRPRDDRPSVLNRVGYAFEKNGEKFLAMPPGSFKSELCAGRDPRVVADVLFRAGLLAPGNEGGGQTKGVRVPGDDKVSRLYLFRTAMLEEGGE